MATCACANCGERFTGITAFDGHLNVDYSRRPPVFCRLPALAGMSRDRAGRWGFPASDADRARLAVLKARTLVAEGGFEPPASGL